MSLAKCIGPVLLVLSGAPVAAGAAVADYRVTADTIARPLVDASADPQAGREVFLDRDRGHCLLCHRVATLDAPFQGNLGPELTTVGDRLTAAQLRLRVVDAERLNAETRMPSYHRVAGLEQVQSDYAGRPVLSALEVEQLVAFLTTLVAP